MTKLSSLLYFEVIVFRLLFIFISIICAPALSKQNPLVADKPDKPDKSDKPLSQTKGSVSVERFHYANTPDALLPYRQSRPYRDFFTSLPNFQGAGREKREPEPIDEIKVGFIGPLEDEDKPIMPSGFRSGVKNDPKTLFGRHMLWGASLAIEEANSAGGYKGKPFSLVRRTDLVQWGQTSNELAKFAYEDEVWVILSGIDSNHNHVLVRATLKAEVPIVNAGSTDPTLLEHAIPWIIRCVNDDRQNAYVLLNHIYRIRGYTQVAVLRVNNRDGRVGIMEFVQGAQRLGHPILIEQRFQEKDIDFRDQLLRIQQLPIQAIVIWANDPKQAGLIVKQMRKLGLNHPVFGFDRMAHPLFLEAAKSAAEGVVVTSSYNPDSDDPLWQTFRHRYKERFKEEADAFAAHAYDGMNITIQAIKKARLNRVRIRDALFSLKSYKGVTGQVIFDTVMNDVSPPWLAVVEGGKFRYFKAPSWGVASHRKQETESRKQGIGNREQGTEYKKYKIGLFIPTHGARRSEGLAIQRGAEMAVAKANADADGRFLSGSFRLVVGASDLRWELGVKELVRLIYDEGVWGIIGASDSRTAHLAEQIVTRAKGEVIFITLSTDPTLTQVKIPWFFRIVPIASEAQEPSASLPPTPPMPPMPPKKMSDYAYDATLVLLEAIKKSALEQNRKAIRDVIAKTNQTGVTGLMRFDASGNRLFH